MPVSTRFDDPYYARSDGLAEARHVFLDGNDLAQRFDGAEAFHVAELGFGTGLNFLACWLLWKEKAAPGAVLHFTSFERYPLKADERAHALSAWPELSGPALALAEGDLEGAQLQVMEGDARATVPAWAGKADAWFLDGFAPARNPEMWEPTLLSEVHARTQSGGTLATYSAAGAVRRALSDAGFRVTKRPGYGRKREMVTAVRG